MTSSHANCTHPSTKAARTACRKGRSPEASPARPSKNGATESLRSKIKANRTDGPKLKGHFTEALYDDLKAESEGNAKRTKASQAKAATQQRQNKTDCYVCGSSAGWTDTRNRQPVCMKHVDYDHCRILPL